MRAVEAAIGKRRRHHAAGEPFAKAHHQIICPRGQLSHSRDTAQQIVQRVELRVNCGL